MTRDVNRLAQEEQRIVALAIDAIENHWSRLGRNSGREHAAAVVNDLVTHFMRMTAPELPEAALKMDLIVMRAGSSGPDLDSAQRVTPGNVRLNFGRFAVGVFAQLAAER